MKGEKIIMSGVLTEIVSLLTSGIQGIASGIGSGLQALVTNIFLDGEGTSASPYTLSVYGAVIIKFVHILIFLFFIFSFFR